MANMSKGMPYVGRQMHIMGRLKRCDSAGSVCLWQWRELTNHLVSQ